MATYTHTYYYATVPTFTLIRVDHPAETASWSEEDVISVGSPAGNGFLFFPAGTTVLDDQFSGTLYSDLSPYSGTYYPRHHPSVGNATSSFYSGNNFGRYGVPGSALQPVSGTARDVVVTPDMMVWNSDLTGLISAGSKLYNNKYTTTTGGPPPDLTSSWVSIVDSFVSGTGEGNAFCEVVISGGAASYIYSFGGQVTSGDIGTPSNNIQFLSCSNKNGSTAEAYISPFYHLDDNQHRWLGLLNSGSYTPLTVPNAAGVADGACAVDYNSKTVYFGGGRTLWYSGSYTPICGIRDIWGWHFDWTTGMLTGSPFVAGQMSMPRYKHEMQVANGFLYVMGGLTSTIAMAGLTASITSNTAHEHVERAFISDSGTLVNWAQCQYPMPSGKTVVGAGSGLIDGAARIWPTEVSPDQNYIAGDRYIYLVGGLKGIQFNTTSSEELRTSAQMWSAKLNFITGAVNLPNTNRSGTDGIWMGPAVGESLTCGPNMGPADIKPALPMLENIYQRLVESTLDPSHNTLPVGGPQIIGYRPGLKGTEINGKWRVSFAVKPGPYNSAPNIDVAGYDALSGSYVMVRQVRLEFLVDQTAGFSQLNYFNPARGALYRKSATGVRGGRRLIDIQSGSAFWDTGVSYIYSYVDPDYGRTVGMTSNSASDDYAVFSQITGVLAVALTGTPSWYLNPPQGEGMAGVPYLPLSSASLGEASVPLGTTGSYQDMINATVGQQLSTPSENTLPAYLSRIKALQKTQDLFEQELARQDTLSGSYF